MSDSEYMHIDLYPQHLGISPGVLEGWIKRGLEKGIHYVVIGHQTLIHVKRTDQWISERGQLASDHQVEVSEYGYGKTANRSMKRQSRAIRTPSVTSPLRSRGASGSPQG
jgi:hypothetical protein